MRKLFYLCLLFCFLASAAMAQTETESPDDTEYEDGTDYESEEDYSTIESVEHVTIDPAKVSEAKGYKTEKIPVRRFDQEKWKKVVGGENFSEVNLKKKKKDPSDASSGEQGNTRISEEDEEDDEDESSNFSFNAPLGSPVLTMLFYGVVIAIIGYILYLIIRSTSVKNKIKDKNGEPKNVADAVEDIKELEIDRLLREALASGNYKLAIRIYFLGLLKNLDAAGIIHWKRDKTNREYLSEIFNKSYHFEDISRLTQTYEEVWYGEHTFSTEIYQKIIAHFKSVDSKINVPASGEN